jgi:glycosyltransferase involved in cell wall biosynthesis
MRTCIYGVYPADIFYPSDISLHYILNAPYMWWTMRKLVKEQKIDVILSANIIPSFFANFLGVPVVIDYLDHFEESGAVYYKNKTMGNIVQYVVRTLTRFNLRRAKQVITVTKELAQFLLLTSVSKTTPVTIIPNGVDTKTFYPLHYDVPYDRCRKTIGYVGSIEEWVDFETIISSLKELDVNLLIVGSQLHTNYASHLFDLAKQYDVSDQVIFGGSYPYDDLKSIISYMDIGLNPLKPMFKNTFSAGGKVFNYLACGVPVLSTPVVSLQGIVKHGIWYYNSREEFIEMVNKLLHTTIDKSVLVSEAKKFDWDDLAEQYEQVLLNTVKSHEKN